MQPVDNAGIFSLAVWYYIGSSSKRGAAVFRPYVAVLVSLTLPFLITGSSLGEIRYTVTNLGTVFGTSGSGAYDINDSGQVLIQSGSHSFICDDGTACDLGSWLAQAINSRGQAVGYTTISGTEHGLIYSNGDITDLGAGSNAYDINTSGQVVGRASFNMHWHAFLRTDGTMKDLGTLGGSDSQAYGVNDNGQVVGYAFDAGSNQRAFLYSNGAMTDLGTFGGHNSWAYSINNSSQIVGAAYFADNSVFHAFLYDHDEMTDLTPLADTTSQASDINASGQVVGYAWTGKSFYAFLYSNGKMTDLNSLIDPAAGWVLYRAYAINDEGQIVGFGTQAHGQFKAFLLTPIVPEPSTLALLGIAAIGLLAHVRRRKGIA
jgi:probable HAF family extracellular repeat protein